MTRNHDVLADEGGGQSGPSNGGGNGGPDNGSGGDQVLADDSGTSSGNGPNNGGGNGGPDNGSGGDYAPEETIHQESRDDAPVNHRLSWIQAIAASSPAADAAHAANEQSHGGTSWAERVSESEKEDSLEHPGASVHAERESHHAEADHTGHDHVTNHDSWVEHVTQEDTHVGIDDISL